MKKHLLRKLLYLSSMWAVTFSPPPHFQLSMMEVLPQVCAAKNTGLPLPCSSQLWSMISSWELQATKPPQCEASDVMPQRTELWASIPLLKSMKEWLGLRLSSSTHNSLIGWKVYPRHGKLSTLGPWLSLSCLTYGVQSVHWERYTEKTSGCCPSPATWSWGRVIIWENYVSFPTYRSGAVR